MPTSRNRFARVGNTAKTSGKQLRGDKPSTKQGGIISRPLFWSVEQLVAIALPACTAHFDLSNSGLNETTSEETRLPELTHAKTLPNPVRNLLATQHQLRINVHGRLWQPDVLP